jgi:hypothetical protein
VQTRNNHLRRFALAALIVGALAIAAPASWPPPGVPSGTMPWEAYKYQGYREARPVQPVPHPPTIEGHPSPRKYTIQITILPYRNTDPRGVAYVMAHMPPGGDLWIEDVHFIKNADKAEYDMVSPPLEPNKTYTYTFRARWLEDGKWVSQMHTFPVKAGDVHCVDVVPHNAEAVTKEIAANLAKLDPADKRSAEAQKTCAVQDGVRLGAMGKPVKVAVKGKDVFLCCEGCRETALKNPDKTLKTVETLMATEKK